MSSAQAEFGASPHASGALMPDERLRRSSRPVLVQKFGGSSLGTPGRIKRAAKRVAASQRAGYDVVVVVSAMGDSTDRLLTLASRVAKDPAARGLDLVLSTGEGVSAPLMSMALTELGVPAVSLLGFQAGIQTDRRHAKARIVGMTPGRIERELAAGRVVVVAGFQGMGEEMEVTTLGRGGSDTTAVALAAALKAQACEIFTDVRGIYTADPRFVPTASHEGVTDMSFTVSSAHGRQAERIVQGAAREIGARTVLAQNGLAKVSVIGSGIRGQPGVAAIMFRTLSDHGINIEMISTSEVRITCIIDAKRVKDAVAALHEAFKL